MSDRKYRVDFERKSELPFLSLVRLISVGAPSKIPVMMLKKKTLTLYNADRMMSLLSYPPNYTYITPTPEK
jgi:hypothetical protein